MKKLLLSIKFILLLFIAHAQDNGHLPLENVVNAMKNDRIADMAQYFDNYVPVTINNSQQVYSHNQAQVVLQDFFDRNKPGDFLIMDNGSPDTNTKFLIGTFIATANNTKYTVYVLMKTKNSAYYIQEIRLSKEIF